MGPRLTVALAMAFPQLRDQRSGTVLHDVAVSWSSCRLSGSEGFSAALHARVNRSSLPRSGGPVSRRLQVAIIGPRLGDYHLDVLPAPERFAGIRHSEDGWPHCSAGRAGTIVVTSVGDRRPVEAATLCSVSRVPLACR